MDTQAGFTSSARFLLVAGAFVVVVAGMKAAAPLVTPFLLAAFIAIIAAPPLFFLKHRGAPTWLALLAVSAIIVAIGGLIVAVISGSLGAFTANLPEYQAKLKDLTLQFIAWLEALGIDVPREALTTYLDAGKAMKMAGVLLGGLGDMLTNALLILLTVVFMLVEATHLPDKLQLALKTPEASKDRLQSVLDSINRYMVLKTVMSLLTGALVWLWLTFLGVDFAPLWALIAFLFNYVPTIGSIIAAVPAVLLALVQLDPESAFWVAVGYFAVNTVVGNVLEPRFMGRGLGLSTLVVFISLVFWGWVLGSVGMFLSVPLTMALQIALDANPQTRPIAILLGQEVVRPPESNESSAASA